jgi:RimJ/RimL family protein N-acetyltransferase
MNTLLIPELETPRLRLRALDHADFDAYAAMWKEPEVVRFIGGVPFTRELAWARFLRQMGAWHYLGFGFFAIEDKATRTFIGEAGFHDLHRNITPSIEGTLEAGWVLSTAAHGKGIAEEATRAVLAWAEQDHASKRVTCIIRPNHFASLRIAAKLGFTEFARTDYNGSPIVVFERLSKSVNVPTMNTRIRQD